MKSFYLYCRARKRDLGYWATKNAKQRRANLHTPGKQQLATRAESKTNGKKKKTNHTLASPRAIQGCMEQSSTLLLSKDHSASVKMGLVYIRNTGYHSIPPADPALHSCTISTRKLVTFLLKGFLFRGMNVTGTN